MRLTSVVFLAVFLLFALNPTNAFALKCKALPSVEAKYEKYDGIIIGYVEDIVQTDETKRVDLKVLKSYKGIDDATLTIQEDVTWGPSNLGEENLYFLIQTDKGWENPLCAPTEKVGNASEELEYLRDKEISLKTISASTNNTSRLSFEPVVAETTGITGVSSDNSSTNKWIFILSGACILVLLGLGIKRFVKRGKE